MQPRREGFIELSSIPALIIAIAGSICAGFTGNRRFNGLEQFTVEEAAVAVQFSDRARRGMRIQGEKRMFHACRQTESTTISKESERSRELHRFRASVDCSLSSAGPTEEQADLQGIVLMHRIMDLLSALQLLAASCCVFGVRIRGAPPRDARTVHDAALGRGYS